MKRRTKAVLLIGSLAVVAVVATVGVLTTALARALDPHEYCATGFSPLVGCNYHWSSRTTGQSDPDPLFPTTASAASSVRPVSGSTAVDITSWAIAQCPGSAIARPLLCPAPSAEAPAQAASDDLASGLPRPRPWLLTTGRKSRFIEAVHVETPLGLATALRFYRAELSKRGWTEDDGAVVARDGAVIAFTTSDGPALLRLTRHDDRTIADLSLRKSAAIDAGVLPKQGQVRLLLGNTTDEAAVITINEQTIKLAAHAGHQLTDNAITGSKSPDSPDIDLPPGKYKVTLKTADGVAKSSEFAVAADETWGMLVGPAGIPLPMRLH